jgi:site-specific recombinase XerD
MMAMKTKSSGGRLKYGILIPTEDARIDPVRTVKEYRMRTSRFSEKESSFFFQEDGIPLQSPERLAARYLVPYLRRAGIPSPYTAYSVKKAVITRLFNNGHSKEQISSFTGHSNNANTALKYYHDPTNNWLGHVIAQGATQAPEVEVPEKVSEEGEEEGDE